MGDWLGDRQPWLTVHQSRGSSLTHPKRSLTPPRPTSGDTVFGATTGVPRAFANRTKSSKEGERPGFARARHAQAQRSRMMTSQLFIDHALEIADFMVALELSAAAAGVELIHAYTLLESAPKRTSKRGQVRARGCGRPASDGAGKSVVCGLNPTRCLGSPSVPSDPRNFIS